MKPIHSQLERGNGHPAVAGEMERNKVPGVWLAFICYCRQMGYGEIERLRIQDGVPILAEVATRKVKFGS